MQACLNYAGRQNKAGRAGLIPSPARTAYPYRSFRRAIPHTFYVVAVLIPFLGITASIKMPTDIFPEIEIPVVKVIWAYTGLSTPEMEQRVTTYSQYSISTSVNGIKNIEAQTLAGLSMQKINFKPDVNLDLAIAQIVSATNSIRALMPQGIQPPIVVQFNASSVPVVLVSLSSLRPKPHPPRLLESQVIAW